MSDKNIKIYEKYMKRCIKLAQKAAGNTSPNPMVGAVILDKNLNFVSEGYHKKCGEAHAEVNAINAAKEKGIDTLAIVNVVGSSIAREANKVLYIKAGPEIAVATTKAYSCQLMMLSLIAMYLGIKKGSLNESILKEYEELDSLLEEALDNTDELFKIAKKHAPCVIFIDEIDAIGMDREHNKGTSENDQTIDALLQAMDGFNGRSKIQVEGFTKLDLMEMTRKHIYSHKI